MPKRIRTHPGEILRQEFLVPLGMSANALARELHVPANRITAMINGSRSVTAECALRLNYRVELTRVLDGWMARSARRSCRFSPLPKPTRVHRLWLP